MKQLYIHNLHQHMDELDQIVDIWNLFHQVLRTDVQYKNVNISNEWEK